MVLIKPVVNRSYFRSIAKLFFYIILQQVLRTEVPKQTLRRERRPQWSGPCNVAPVSSRLRATRKLKALLKIAGYSHNGNHWTARWLFIVHSRIRNTAALLREWQGIQRMCAGWSCHSETAITRDEQKTQLLNGSMLFFPRCSSWLRLFILRILFQFLYSSIRALLNGVFSVLTWCTIHKIICVEFYGIQNFAY